MKPSKGFKQTPKCEFGCDRPATHFVVNDTQRKSCWQFSCDKCEGPKEIYHVPFVEFFQSPSATVDWLAHFSGKSWMDWKNFGEMMERFREATKSFWA